MGYNYNYNDYNHFIKKSIPFSNLYKKKYYLIFQQQAQNTITFKLIPNLNRPLIRESRVRLRALFDYDPHDDKYIPCKEAGLSFSKGDILHIVSQDDPYW